MHIFPRRRAREGGGGPAQLPGGIRQDRELASSLSKGGIEGVKGGRREVCWVWFIRTRRTVNRAGRLLVLIKIFELFFALWSLYAPTQMYTTLV